MRRNIKKRLISFAFEDSPYWPRFQVSSSPTPRIQIWSFGNETAILTKIVIDIIVRQLATKIMDVLAKNSSKETFR